MGPKRLASVKQRPNPISPRLPKFVMWATLVISVFQFCWPLECGSWAFLYGPRPALGLGTLPSPDALLGLHDDHRRDG